MMSIPYPNLKSVTALAPATVANVSCGFDIMGFALSGPGDLVTISLLEEVKSSYIENSGPYGRLVPVDYHTNTAAIAVNAYLSAIGRSDIRLRINLEKNLPLGSGMGSSAASAAAALVAINHLLGEPLSAKELIPFAMESERAASGSAHADNAAPSILGGFVLIRSYNPLDIIQVNCPDDLFCIVTHPHIEVKTSDARRILRKDIPMQEVIRQSANAAAFMTGILLKDYDLIGRSVNDLLAEPKRTRLIPGFDRAKKAATDAGALACGISGSGPSIFALFRGSEKGDQIANAVMEQFSNAGLESESFFSSLNENGAIIIEEH
jgi:homoserine kinase